MKKELLSPVGNFSALKSAIQNGADAVYLGGKKFGARAFAANFSDDEMKEAIFLCHLYGVRIYVTVNTMVYESELNEVLEYVEFLYKNHVDAIIMADLGLISLCHEKFPDLELHASTQIHTHNISQLKLLKKIGVKRVVLARELSLEEIQKFPDDIEIEVFVHGALCISYSGQCLFSSLLLNRSGNRGECAQICRLPFSLLKNGEVVKTKGNFLLSTKDLNTSKKFVDLMKSNILSFKIEGRMKSPAYVGFMTHFYRKLIDQYEKEGQCLVSKEDERNASVLFGRGFTKGKIFNAIDEEFIEQRTSNHQGIYIGDIVILNSKKIGIRLTEDLHQEDGIRFASEDKGMIVNFLYHENGKLISNASAGELIFVDNKVNVTKKCKVMKTTDILLEKEILNVEEKQIPISMNAKVFYPEFILTVSDGTHIVTINKDIVEYAKSQPIKEEKILEQLKKLGGTPFILKKVDIQIDNNLFINIKAINDMRREAITKLIKMRTERLDGRIKMIKEESFAFDDKLEIFASARNEEQIKTLLELNVDGIYVSDYSLYQKYRDKQLIYRTNRIRTSNKFIDADKYLCGETGSFMDISKNKSIDYFLNIANHASANFLVKEGAKRISITPEINLTELAALLNYYPKGNPFEYIIYGRLEVMILNHCIVKTNLKHEKICENCQNNKFALKDRNGAIYPLLMDENHHTHIYFHDVIDDLSDASKLYQMGLRKFRFEFFEESKETIVKLVKNFKNGLHV